MNSREMSYGFKQKLNVIDSQQYKDLIVPEIDWYLNEAQEMFIKKIVQPKDDNKDGFEETQRNIDNISTIVVNQVFLTGDTPIVFDNKSYVSKIPKECWIHLNSTVYASKGNCIDKRIKELRGVQHDDSSEDSAFDKSSFEWSAVNYRYIQEGMKLITDGTFSISRVVYDYVKYPRRIINAGDWVGGKYNTLDGIVLSGYQDSELPIQTHNEIVDIAVMLATSSLNMPTFPQKKFMVDVN